MGPEPEPEPEPVYRARRPREDVNVSKTHPLREAATLIVGLVAVMLFVTFAAARVTEWVARLIPVRSEVELFADVDLLSQIGALADDGRQERVEEIVHRLASHLDDFGYEVHVVVLDMPDVNAFALPGGTVAVTSGLLDGVESENELAFVLGHELGHLQHRDVLSRLGREIVVGVAWAVLTGGGGGLDPLAVAQQLASRGFDRGDEEAADAVGLELVAREYGHVAEATRFFERLSEGTRIEALAAYLTIHPASTDRVTNLGKLADERGWPAEGRLAPF